MCQMILMTDWPKNDVKALCSLQVYRSVSNKIGTINNHITVTFTFNCMIRQYKNCIYFQVHIPISQERTFF